MWKASSHRGKTGLITQELLALVGAKTETTKPEANLLAWIIANKADQSDGECEYLVKYYVPVRRLLEQRALQREEAMQERAAGGLDALAVSLC